MDPQKEEEKSGVSDDETCTIEPVCEETEQCSCCKCDHAITVQVTPEAAPVTECIEDIPDPLDVTEGFEGCSESNKDAIMHPVTDVVENIKEGFGHAGEEIVKFGQNVKEGIKVAGEDITEGFENTVENIKEGVEHAGEEIVKVGLKVKEEFKDAGTNIQEGFEEINKSIKCTIVPPVTDAVEKIKEGFEHAGEEIVNFGQNVKEGIKVAGENITEGFEHAGEGIEQFGQIVKEDFKNAGTKITEGFENTVGNIKEGFDHAGEEIEKFGQIVKEDLKNAGTNIAEGCADMNESIKDTIVPPVTDAVAKIKELFDRAVEKIKKCVQNVKEAFGCRPAPPSGINYITYKATAFFDGNWSREEYMGFVASCVGIFAILIILIILLLSSETPFWC